MMGERLGVVSRSLEIEDAVSPEDDHAVFTKSIADVERMARSASTALGFLQSEAPSSGSFSKWEVRLDPAQRVYLRLMSSFEVPFKKADVDAAIHSLRTQLMPNYRGYDPQVRPGASCVMLAMLHRRLTVLPQRFGGSPDMVIVKAMENYSSPVESGIYRARQVNHVLYVGDERSVSLSVSYMETADSSRRTAGMLLKSQQWIVLSQRAHLNQRTGDTQYSTLIQIYSTISSATANPGRWRRDVAESIVVPVWERECSIGQSEIESILLEQALNRRQ